MRPNHKDYLLYVAVVLLIMSLMGLAWLVS